MPRSVPLGCFFYNDNDRTACITERETDVTVGAAERAQTRRAKEWPSTPLDKPVPPLRGARPQMTHHRCIN
jgi:hypothetical protein